MKYIYLFTINLLWFSLSFCQTSKNWEEFKDDEWIECMEKLDEDTVLFFSIIKLKNDSLYPILDSIIKLNQECLKNSDWEKLRDDYYYSLSVTFMNPGALDNTDMYNDSERRIFSVSANGDRGWIKRRLSSYCSRAYWIPKTFNILIYKEEFFFVYHSHNDDDFWNYFEITKDWYGVYSNNETGNDIIWIKTTDPIELRTYSLGYIYI